MFTRQNSDVGIQTEAVTQCPACGGSGQVRYENLEDRAYGVAGRWQIMECLKCASGWLSPAPVPEDLDQSYVGNVLHT